MNICGDCKRLCGTWAQTCPICGGHKLKTVDLPSPLGEELKNYRIDAQTITIGETNYGIKGIIGQGGHGVVLEVTPEATAETSYALKVPLHFNEWFTNNKGNRQSQLTLSHKYISHEIDMLKKLKAENPVGDDRGRLHIFHAGPVHCTPPRATGAQWTQPQETKTFPAILMEKADTTLKELMDAAMEDKIHLCRKEKMTIIRQLTNAVEQLHAQTLVHRDLSPHNIFLVSRNHRIYYVLGDLGTSKPAPTEEKNESTTRMAFHDRYLDPAWLNYGGLRYDCRIDIYQLGVIITELLMGEYWLSGEEESVTSAVMTTSFETDYLLTFATDVIPPPLLKILCKATTGDIEKRYAKAAQLGADLRNALDAVPDPLAIPGTESGKESRTESGALRKTILLEYKYLREDNDDTRTNPEPEQHMRLHYRGVKRIRMDTARGVTIDFSPHVVVGASFKHKTFLKHRVEGTLLHIDVDGDAVEQTVAPLFRPGLGQRLRGLLGRDKDAAQDHHRSHRLEFEAQAIVRVETARRETNETGEGHAPNREA